MVEDFLQIQPPAASPLAPQCSAKGCRATAEWQLHWNNPKIHTPERRKTWLACGEHRATLGGFLEVRGFLREVTPFASSDGAIVS
ncbi:hypothetical protein Ait01nite_089130 [Actinoplanes italicus]|uniref:Acetone carboxylase n=1 Tax=Actinoplanes italicus TaxID=113567 RepID=A0A2T0JIL7_9ACTN|nr:hypothetical protein [Actinoplanes italicus]PRX07329.1 hypothetical protein CLV67_1424 [Actinoplanes italicus]GIE35868.1 hypothetical protein Ait01nite_089130 [Actinoplanes italicus]